MAEQVASGAPPEVLQLAALCHQFMDLPFPVDFVPWLDMHGWRLDGTTPPNEAHFRDITATLRESGEQYTISIQLTPGQFVAYLAERARHE